MPRNYDLCGTLIAIITRTRKTRFEFMLQWREVIKVILIVVIGTILVVICL